MFHNLGYYDVSENLIWRKRTKLHNENPTKQIAYFRRLWVKKLRHSEIVSGKDGYLYRSIREHASPLAFDSL